MIRYLLLAASLLLLLFLVLFKSGKHQRNINTGKKVLLKIRSFNGPYREAQIFTYLRKISPYVFEELLLSIFQEKGYNITRNKRYSHDGGLDGKVFRNNELYLIQAKRYKGHINPKHLSEFSNCVTRLKAKGGFFIHTGRTGKDQLTNFRYSNIEILSGQKLIDFLINL